MREVYLFMMLTLDGYMEGPDHDISWHNVDEEFEEFAVNQLSETGTILFGRRTYELMESYWPTKEAIQDDPKTAEYMNTLPKVVFSHTLKTVHETQNWKNITLVNDHITETIQNLKEEDGGKISVLGSNNLCVTLLELGLLDELRIMINPVAIGQGTPLFYGIKNKFTMELFNTKQFNSGNMLLYYHPQMK